MIRAAPEPDVQAAAPTAVQRRTAPEIDRSPEPGVGRGPTASALMDGTSQVRARQAANLQRSVGNARLFRLAEPRPAEDSPDRPLPDSGGPEAWAGESGAAVLTKLTIGAVDDPLEREADAFADHVMRMPADRSFMASSGSSGMIRTSRRIQRMCAKCASGEPCPTCSAASTAGPRPVVQRFPAAGSGPSDLGEIRLSRFGGQPLSDRDRGFFEPHLGADLGGVRIHADRNAAALNDRLGAQAFTHGDHIYFNEGSYAPGSSGGRRLLAHELAHVAQQGGASATPALQRYTWGDAVVEGAAIAGEAIGEVGETIVEAGAEAFDWLATAAGRMAVRMASALGGTVSVSASGIVVTLPKVCPVPATVVEPKVPGYSVERLAPILGLPIGPVLLTGDIGITGAIEPEVQLQVGPYCLNGVRIVINPLTGSASISGSVSATAAGSLGAEVRLGLKGGLSVSGVIPVGGVPVPISIPVIHLEGGVAGMVRGIGAGTLTLGSSLGFAGGVITVSSSGLLDIGFGADAFLGAYGQLDLLGQNVCRIYWQPYEWHGEIGGSVGLAASMAIVPGLIPTVGIDVSSVVVTGGPINEIPLAIDRGGFTDDCPLLDTTCNILRTLGLLPSQNEGTWSWSGPYGPGPRLPGPLLVYTRNPGIPSGSLCRGACGEDCKTCEQRRTHYRTDPLTGQTWEYLNLEICPTHEGCRQHDAAFDWAAAVKGEIGRGAMTMPWHMAANVECMCNYPAGNCIAWVAGLPPHDQDRLYFADSAAPISSVPPDDPTGREDCLEENPGALDCDINESDRDIALEYWGSRYGFERFGGFHRVSTFGAGTMFACETAAGELGQAGPWTSCASRRSRSASTGASAATTPG